MSNGMKQYKSGGGQWRGESSIQDQSWGSSIQRYDSEKLAAPPLAGDIAPKRLYRDGRFNHKAEERQYDCLDHKWRDPEQEVNMSGKEAKKQLAAMNRAKDLALRYESPFDVINQEPKLLSSGREIIPDKPKTPPKADLPPWNKYQPKNHGLKEFYWPHLRESKHNIINNRYLDRDHDKALAAEQTAAAATAADKFSKANHFNAVAGTFYDPKMEQEYRQVRALEEQTHGQDKFNRLPISIKRGEGSSYNIVAPSLTYNGELMTEQEAIEDAKRAQPRLKYAHEAHVVDRREYVEDRDATRKINRVSEQRRNVPLHRGYDIINCVPYYGRTGRPVPGSTFANPPAMPASQRPSHQPSHQSSHQPSRQPSRPSSQSGQQHQQGGDEPDALDTFVKQPVASSS